MANNNTQNFIKSLKNSEQGIIPYKHFLLKNLMSEKLLHDVRSLPFIPPELDYKKGTREEFNKFRQYINQENIEKYSAASELADIFLDIETIKTIESLGNISLEGSLLRIEYAVDKGNFWLGPHTDLGVKLFTILIYIAEGEDSLEWGTDIYHDADHHHSTVPYVTNGALMFYPTDHTWHGFEPREIKGIRKTLIVNYVTKDWRNREELVHPTIPVY
jgi:hypothetical protein